MLDLSRRRFFGILAAPAIVRAASLMPVSVWVQSRAPGLVYFNAADHFRVSAQISTLFAKSVAEPAVRGFLAEVANMEMYLRPERSTRRDTEIADHIVRNNWMGAARLAGANI